MRMPAMCRMSRRRWKVHSVAMPTNPSASASTRPFRKLSFGRFESEK